MTSLTDEMVEGTPVKIGRQVYIVPALNFKLLKALKPQLELMSSIKAGDAVTDEIYGAMVEVIHAAVKRNYPNLSRDELEDGMDLANRDKIVKAVMGQSGLTPSGEAKPAAS